MNAPSHELSGQSSLVRRLNLTPEMRRTVSIGLIAALIVLSVVMHLLFLDADPSLTLSWSHGPYMDEGQYTHNARNMALWGRWRTNEYNNMYISPILNLLTFASFRLLGVGHWQARLVSVIFSLGTIVCLAAALWRPHQPKVAVLATLFLGLDFFWLQYARLALMDVPLVFWMALAFAGWLRSVKGSIAWAVVAGMVSSMAWVIKSLGLPFLAVPLLSTVCLYLQRKDRATRRTMVQVTAALLFGMGLIWSIWYVSYLVPNRAEVMFYTRVFAGERIPASGGEIVAAIQRNFLSLETTGIAPLLFLLGIAGLLVLLAEYPWRNVSPEMIFLAIWLVIYAAVLYVSPYSPNRYWVTIVPPLAGLSAYALAAFTGNSGHPLITGHSLPGKLAFLVFLTLPLLVLFILIQNFVTIAPALNRRAVRYPLYLAMSLYLTGVANPLSPAFRRLRDWMQAKAPLYRPYVLAVVLGLYLLWNGGHYVDWAFNRHYTVVEAATMLDDLLPPGAVVLGGQATTLTMESDLIAIPIWLNNEWVNADKPWQRFQADYWIEQCGVDCSDTHLPTPATFMRSFRNQRYVMGLWKVTKVDDSSSPDGE